MLTGQLQTACQLQADLRSELTRSKARQGATHLLLAAVDLPFLFIGQREHGLPVLVRQVQFILQQQGEAVIGKTVQ